jgi:hypothetical protein
MNILIKTNIGFNKVAVLIQKDILFSVIAPVFHHHEDDSNGTRRFQDDQIIYQLHLSFYPFTHPRTESPN